jgi:hypothetical protein
MSATMTIAACVMLTVLVFAIDAWSIRRTRRAILQVPRHDPLDPDVQ